MNIDQVHHRFNSTGRVGALLKVLAPGTISAADRIVVEERPGHGVTVADLAAGPSALQMRQLLDSGVPLAKSVRARAHRLGVL